MGSWAAHTDQAETNTESFEDYAIWVKRIALQLHARMPWADIDELIQWGTLSLLEAKERFDPSRGKPFKAFAAQRIRGSMIDSLQREGREVRSSRGDPDLVAERTMGHSHEFDDPMTILLRHADNALVAEAIGKLSERQQFILNLFYAQEHNNREIAQALEVSEAYVSKTRRRAIDRLADIILNKNPSSGDLK